jgi:hypothetical protein
MKKLLSDVDMGDMPDEVFYEIVILHNLGVSVEDLKYLLAIRLNQF